MKKAICLSTILLIFTIITSCEKTCTDGYSGVNCEIPPANLKFVGTWNLTEVCSSTGIPDPYILTISQNNSSFNKFDVIGFWTFATPVTCDINTSDEKLFTTTRQPLYTTWDIEVTAGRISNTSDSLYLSYNIYSTGSSILTDQCSSIAIKN